jgi:formamidopyrimidine-DNA glycosylase
MIFLTVGGRTSCVVPSRQKKTGRVAAGVKEEELKAKTEANTKEGKKSRFFDKSEDADDGQEAEPEARPAKKARKNTPKVVKEEEDEPVSVERADSMPKKGARKMKEKPISPPSDTGRRRSTRLSKITS